MDKKHISRKEHHHNCGCNCNSSERMPGGCPPTTIGGGPRRVCEQRREEYATGNPYLRFDLNLVYWFFNNTTTFAGASNQCASMPGFRVISPQELEAISDGLVVDGEFLCPMLVWTNNNGVPTLAYVFPGRPNPVRLVRTPSLQCPAYHFCVGEIE